MIESPPGVDHVIDTFYTPVRTVTRGRPVEGRVFACRAGEADHPHKLLYLHGLGPTLASFCRLAQPLTPVSDSVFIDLLGQGRSDAAPGSGTDLPAQVVVTHAVLDTMQWPSAVLIGHSWGAAVALGAALAWPRRVAAIVLVSGVSCPQPLPWWVGFFSFPFAPPAAQAYATLASWTGFTQLVARRIGYDPDALHDMTTMFRRRDRAEALARGYRDLRTSSYWELMRRLEQVRCPVLVVHGDEDPWVPPEVARCLHERVPDSEIEWIEGGDHLSHQTDGEAIGRRIRRFLAERFPDGLPSARG